MSLTETNGSTRTEEDGVVGGPGIDSYFLSLQTSPTSGVDITVSGDPQILVSLDGTTFGSSLVIPNITDTNSIEIFVVGHDDFDAEGIHSGVITHSISASADANYPTDLVISPLVVTIADDELQPVVGVDFDEASGTAPTNWTTISNAFTSGASNLTNEVGDSTAIDLNVVVSGGAAVAPTPPPTNLPQHVPSLSDIDGARFSTDSITLTWSDLTPGTEYNLWLFLAENYSNTASQTVTISGGGTNPAPFTMDNNSVSSNTLFVNGQIADSSKTLDDDAVRATADASGQIVIVVQAEAGAQAWLNGAAIQEAPIVPPPVINEILVDPAGGSDNPNEYVEIRGAAGQSLDGIHLVFMESDSGGTLGQVNNGTTNVIDLSGTTIGSNGFLAIVDDTGASDSHPYSIASATTIINIDGLDFENASWSALLIDIGTGTPPTSGQDLDTDDNGLDALPTGWTLLDSVAVLDGGATDRGYSPIVFSSNGNGSAEPGGTVVNVGTPSDRVHHVMRIGDSVGSSASDWVAFEFDDSISTAPDWRVATSSDPAYLVNEIITNHLGASNPTFAGVPEPEVNVQGGTPPLDIADGDTTPSSSDGTNFGSLLTAGGSATSTFTIQNLGTAPLSVASVTIAGNQAADFTVSNFTAAAVAAGGFLTFDVTFDPSADGSRMATVQIVSDDSDENPYTFDLTGNGVAASALNSLVINEVLADPNSSGANNFDTDGNGVAESGDEFFELFNTSAAPLDVGGLQFWDASGGGTHYFTIPESTTLGANSFLLIVSDIDVDGGGALPVLDLGSQAFDMGGGLSLNNGGDNIVVYDPATDQFIQALYNGAAAVDPSNYSGFSGTASRIGSVLDLGQDAQGVSLALSPDGDTSNIVLHNTLGAGVDLATPGTSNESLTNVVNIAVAPASVDEDGVANLVYTLTRLGELANPLEVQFTFGGTAEPSDYVATHTGLITFPVDSATVVVEVDPSDDLIAEADETVTISLANASGYVIGPNSEASGTIADDDIASLTVDVQTDSISEAAGNSASDVVVTRNFDLDNDLVVSLSSDDTSEATIQDTVMIPAGQTSVTVPLNAIDDAIIDGTQTVTISASATLGGGGAGSPEPDTGFSLDGASDFRLNASISPRYMDVAVQPDGKIIGIGQHVIFGDAYWEIVRINTDGTLDSTFGSDGIVTIDFPGSSSLPEGILIHPDGKVSVNGNENGKGTVVRLNPDGTLDNSFGSGGIVTIGLSGQYIYKGVINPDGSTVYVGRRVGSSVGALLVKLNPDGSLDPTFGTDGKVVFDPDPTLDEFGLDIKRQPDGRLVVGGKAWENGINARVFFARFNADGSTDTSFGSGGFQILELAQRSEVLSIALQDDGSVVGVGHATPSGEPTRMLVIRLTSDGQLDTGFSSDGIDQLVFGFLSEAYDVVIDESGKPLIVGGGDDGGGNVLRTMVRYNNDGTLDNTFSDDGVHFFPRVGTGGFQSSIAAALTPDGGLVTFSGLILGTTPTGYQFEKWILPIGSTLISGSDIVDVTDDDAEFAVAPNNAVQPEGNSGDTSFTFTVTRSGDTSVSASVDFATSGSGVNPASSSDFGGTLPSGTINFAAGQTTQTITIDVSSDLLVEPHENFTVTLSNPSAPATITTATAEGRIQNDDVSSISVAVAPSSVAEDGATNLVYTFTRDNTSVESPSLTVNFATSGTATPGTDFSAIGNTVTFASGQITVDKIVDPTIDNEHEPDETVTLTVVSAAGYVVGSPDAATATIVNDDTSSLVLSIVQAEISESGGTSVATVSRGADSSGALMINLSSDDPGEATVPDAVMIADGATSVDFTITGQPDSIVDGTQTVIITASAGGYFDGTDSVDVLDVDVPTLTVDVLADSISENAGDSATQVIITRNTDTTSPLVVSLLSDDVSEASVPPTATIPAGQTSVTVPVGAVDDLIFDGDQPVTISADTMPQLVLDPTFSDDGIQSISFIDGGGQIGTNPRQVIQPDGKIITAYNKSNIVFRVRRHLENGEVDTTFGTDGVVITSLVGSNIAESVDDVILQSDQKIVVVGTIGNSSVGYDLFLVRYLPDGTLDTTFGTDGAVIFDGGLNSEYSRHVFQQGDKLVLVGGRPNPTLWRFNSDGSLDTSFGSNGIVSVPIGNATQGIAGYGIQADGKIVVAGQSGFFPGPAVPKLFVSRFTEDGILDTGFGTNGLTVVDGFSQVHDLVITSDQKIVVAAVNASTETDSRLVRFESNGQLDSTFGAGGILDIGVLNQFDQAQHIEVDDNGLLIVGINTDTNNETLRVYDPDGTLLAETTDTINGESFSGIGDLIVQPDGKPLLSRYGIGIYRFAPLAFGDFIGGSDTVLVEDDDNEIELSIIASAATKDEGNSGDTPFTFTVTRSGDTSVTTTVNYAVSGSGATPANGDDFGGSLPSGTITFAAGETTQLVTIDVSGDTVSEADEGFTVTLSDPAAPATIATATAVGLIQNDDLSTVSVAVAPPSVVEDGAENLVFTFSRDNTSADTPELTVDFAFGGTATAGSDYTASATSVVFAVGSATATVTIDPTVDSVLEPNETVTLTVADGIGYSVGSPDAATGIILDDEGPIDFGDAPTGYPVTLTEDGARHNVASNGPTLGPHRDIEGDGVHSTNADGDDLAGTADDEDGVFFNAPIVVSSSGPGAGTIEIDLQNPSGSTNRLDAWIDFNGDGDWNDLGEKIFDSRLLQTSSGLESLTFPIPQLGETDLFGGSRTAATYARFRLSTAGGLAPTGVAADGEVEDYQIELVKIDQLIVDTLEDENDGDYSLGDLSLREAVFLAGAQLGANEILFDPGLSGGTISLNLGQIVLTDELTITGLGAENLAVSGENASRVFLVEPSANVLIDGLTIRDGHTADSGAGIRNEGALELRNVLVSNNTTTDTDGFGAGIAHTAFGQTLLVIDSSVADNHAESGFGGGIGATASVEITDSMISSNISGNGGGGIYISNATLTVTDSSISDNRVDGGTFNGAGVYGVTSDLTMMRSVVDSNQMDGSPSENAFGAGLHIWNASAMIDQSTIRGNIARGADSDGGGIALRDGSLTITNSTVAANSAPDLGGGIHYQDGFGGGELLVENSTVSGNTATNGGGGISVAQGDLRLRHSTVTNNTAPAGFGGGIANATLLGSGGVARSFLYSSIVSGNVGSDLDDYQIAGAVGTSVFSEDFNLIGIGNAAANFNQPSDQTGVTDPELEPLADNGGLTQTHLLRPNSPAVDRGDVNSALSFDQRGIGFPRLIGPNVDIGAFEAPIATELAIAPLVIQLNEGHEGATTFIFTVFRSGTTSGTTDVEFSVSGTGPDPANAADFGGALPNGVVSFAADQTEKTISINVTGDHVVETDETFVLTLSNPTPLALITEPTATGIIVNDDQSTVDVSVDPVSILEDADGVLTYTFTRDNVSVRDSRTDGQLWHDWRLQRVELTTSPATVVRSPSLLVQLPPR